MTGRKFIAFNFGAFIVKLLQAIVGGGLILIVSLPIAMTFYIGGLISESHTATYALSIFAILFINFLVSLSNWYGPVKFKTRLKAWLAGISLGLLIFIISQWIKGFNPFKYSPISFFETVLSILYCLPLYVVLKVLKTNTAHSTNEAEDC